MIIYDARAIDMSGYKGAGNELIWENAEHLEGGASRNGRWNTARNIKRSSQECLSSFYVERYTCQHHDDFWVFHLHWNIANLQVSKVSPLWSWYLHFMLWNSGESCYERQEISKMSLLQKRDFVCPCAWNRSSGHFGTFRTRHIGNATGQRNHFFANMLGQELQSIPENEWTLPLSIRDSLCVLL